MRIDGNQIAEDVYARLKERRDGFARAPKLGIVVGGIDPVIESFVRIKSQAAERLGVELVRVDLPADNGTAQAIDAIRELARTVDGLIVQLPLPSSIDTNAALSAIPDDKDVDAIATGTSEHVLEAPVVRVLEELLKRFMIDPNGKRSVVVGAGRLVGAPVAAFLKRQGAHVSVFTLEKGSIEDLREADILVSGAGNPGLIKPEYIKHGVVLIDAGTSEQSGRLVGDCDPACEAVAAVFTPVPGGVGPIAVAMIFKNLFDLIQAS